MTTGWGFFMQGSDQMQEVMELGEKLSLAIGCTVHYPAFGKNLFECKCGVIFPVYFVRSKNWDLVKKRHEEEKRLIFKGYGE